MTQPTTTCSRCGLPVRPGSRVGVCGRQTCREAYGRAYRLANAERINRRKRQRYRRDNPAPTLGEPTDRRISMFFALSDLEAIERCQRDGECRSETIRRLVRIAVEHKTPNRS